MNATVESTKLWNVTIKVGGAHEHWAVHATTAQGARDLATRNLAAGQTLSEVKSYEISRYAIRFCGRELKP